MLSEALSKVLFGTLKLEKKSKTLGNIQEGAPPDSRGETPPITAAEEAM